MNKSITLTGCLFLLFLTSHGQIDQVGRVGFELGEMEEKYKAIGLGEDGVMIYRLVGAGESNHVELMKIDTALKVTWKVFFTVPNSLAISKVLYLKGTLYYLLQSRLQSSMDFQVVSIAVNSGTLKTHTIKSGVYFNPIEFAVSDRSAVIAGYFNYRPLVLYYNFEEQKTKILPGFFNEAGEIDQVKPYDDGSVDIIVSAKNYEKKRCLWIRNYDEEGTLIKTTVLQPEKGKSLIFGHSIQLENGGQMVAGVYGRYALAEYSRGIFVAGINPSGEYAINYYNFGQLQNFFSYMKDKREKRVKSRIERKTIRGKKVKFNYRLIVHDIIPYKNQYIMTGEAFFPVYIYPSQFSGRSTTFNPVTTRQGPASTPLTRRVDAIFDGYRYTHAVAIGFDKSGKLVWDNSFEITDIKSMDLEKFVKVKPEKDRILMMYQFGGGLRSKIIKDSDVIEGKTQEPIMQGAYATDVKIVSTENETLDYWYKDYFFAFGIQTIKSKTGFTRRIVFLNKVTHK